MSTTETYAGGGESYLGGKTGIRSWLFTLDHKRIAVMYLVSILMRFPGRNVRV